MSVDVKYDTTPCDGTPGQPWEDFKRRLRNVATRSDERGYSLADHFDDVDEGGGASWYGKQQIRPNAAVDDRRRKGSGEPRDTVRKEGRALMRFHLAPLHLDKREVAGLTQHRGTRSWRSPFLGR